MSEPHSAVGLGTRVCFCKRHPCSKSWAPGRGRQEPQAFPAGLQTRDRAIRAPLPFKVKPPFHREGQGGGRNTTTDRTCPECGLYNSSWGRDEQCWRAVLPGWLGPGSQQLCFICPPAWNGVSVSLSWGGRGGGSHRISLLLLSLSTFSIINVTSFAKFPEMISRDFNMAVF